jgi:hypothetical protein
LNGPRSVPAPVGTPPPAEPPPAGGLTVVVVAPELPLTPDDPLEPEPPELPLDPEPPEPPEPPELPVAPVPVPPVPVLPELAALACAALWTTGLAEATPTVISTAPVTIAAPLHTRITRRATRVLPGSELPTWMISFVSSCYLASAKVASPALQPRNGRGCSVWGHGRRRALGTAGADHPVISRTMAKGRVTFAPTCLRPWRFEMCEACQFDSSGGPVSGCECETGATGDNGQPVCGCSPDAPGDACSACGHLKEWDQPDGTDTPSPASSSPSPTPSS